MPKKALLLPERGTSLIPPDKPGCQMLAVLWSTLAVCQSLEVGMLIAPKRIEDLNQI